MFYQALASILRCGIMDELALGGAIPQYGSSRCLNRCGDLDGLRDWMFIEFAVIIIQLWRFDCHIPLNRLVYPVQSFT